MSIDIIACVDTETTGLDPQKDRVIEVGCALYSIKHRALLDTWSALIYGEDNAAAAVNRIPAEALAHGREHDKVMAALVRMVQRAEIWIAHRVEFDAAFLPDLGRPAVCSKFDIEWPRSNPGASLVEVALAHDVAVAVNHRALADVLLLCRCLERVSELGFDVGAMIAKAMRPKKTYQALVSFDEKEKAKTAGFSWDGKTKLWTKKIAPEDLDALGLDFKVREIA